MQIAFVLICTGTDYWKYLSPAIDSIRKFAPTADIILFADVPWFYEGVVNWVYEEEKVDWIYLPHQGWPNVTLLRYHTILQERELLPFYSHIFYLDVDMRLVAPLGDICSDGITACLHASFIGQPGTPEEDPRSAACVSRSQIKAYYTGCFVGGETKAFLAMAEAIQKSTDADTAKGFIARWHDESHLNRYLFDHPPAKALGVDYNAWQPSPSTVICRVSKGTPDRPAVDGKQPFDPRN
jgi:hypothetical protein